MPNELSPVEAQYATDSEILASLQPEQTQTQTKSERLKKAKQYKVDRLAPESANTMNGMELQEYVGKSIGTNEVYDRDDGTKYQMVQDEDGNWFEQDYNGRTSYLYSDQGQDGSSKFGIARYGIKERYTPGLAYQEGKSNNPNYGWAPGEKGVNVNDGYNFNIQLPENIAKDIEFTIHSNKGQIENRVGGNTYSAYRFQHGSDQLGKGAGEYSTDNAPMQNADYQNSDTKLGSDVMMPALSDKLKRKAFEDRIDALLPDSTPDSSFIGDAARNAASTIIGSSVSAVDAIVNDLPDWIMSKAQNAYYEHAKSNAHSQDELDEIIKNQTEDDLHSHKMNALVSWLHGDGFDDTQEYYKDGVFTKAASKAFGVNTKKAEEEQAEIKKEYEDGNYGSAAWKAFTSGSVVGNVVGSVIMYGMGAGEARAAVTAGKNSGKLSELYSAFNVATKAGNREVAAKIAKSMTAELSTAEKVLAKVIHRAGASALFSSTANEILEERNKQQGNQHATVADVAVAVPFAAIETLMGLESMKIITKPIVKGSLMSLAGALTRKEGDKLWQHVLKVAGSIMSAGLKGATVEGTEEYLQQWADILGKQYNVGDNTLDSIVHDQKNQDEAGIAGIMGIAGAHMSIGTQIGDGLSSTGDKISKIIQENADENKKVNDEEDISEPEFNTADAHKAYGDQAVRFYTTIKKGSGADIPDALSAADDFSKSLDLEEKALKQDDSLTDEEKSSSMTAIKEHRDQISTLNESIVAQLTKAVSSNLGEIKDDATISSAIDSMLDGVQPSIVNSVKSNLVKEDLSSQIYAMNNAISAIRIGSPVEKHGDKFTIPVPKQSISNSINGDMFNGMIIEIDPSNVVEVKNNDNSHYEIKKNLDSINIMNKSLGSMTIKLDSDGNTEPNAVTNAINLDMSKIKIDTSSINNIDVDTSSGSDVNEDIKYEKESIADKDDSKIKVDSRSEIHSEIGKTDTHTEGFSARLINKLAKKYKINNINVQKTLNSALDSFILRDMKNVSKSSNDFQYEFYHGKNGIINKYIDYRKQLELGNAEKAKESIDFIKKKGYDQELKLNRYSVKYEELLSKISKIVNASPIDKIANRIKQLDNIKYKPQHSNRLIKASDIVKDLDLDNKTKNALGIDDVSKSDTLQLMESMQESVDHIDQMLSASKNTRIKDRGYVVNSKDDLGRYQDELLAAEEALADLENKDVTEIIALDKISLELKIKNLKEGISRAEKEINGIITSTNRWVSIQGNFDEKSMRKKIKNASAELSSFKKGSAEYNELEDKIKDMKDSISEHKADKKTIDRINNNLGKNVGREVSGRRYSSRNQRITTSIVKNVKNSVADIKSTIGSNENIEDKDSSFSKSKPIDDALKDAKTVNSLQNELDKNIVEHNNEKNKILSDIKDEKLRLSKIIKDEKIVKNILDMQKHIQVGEKAIDAATIELKKLVDRRKAAAISLEKTLDSASKRLLKEKVTYNEARKIFEDELLRLKGIVEDSEIEDATQKAMAEFEKTHKSKESIIAKLFNGLRNVLYRVMQSSSRSDLGKQILELEERINVIKNDVSDNRIALNEFKNKNPKGFKSVENVGKLYGLLSETSEKNIDKIKKLKSKIDNIVSSINGTHIVKNALYSGFGTTVEEWDGGKKGSYSQPLQLEKLITFRDSILGNVPVDALLANSNIDNYKDIQKKLNDAVDILEKTISVERSKSNFVMFDSPMSGLLFDSSGKINRDIAKVVILSAWEWIATDATGSIYNSDEDIVKIKGYSSEYQVTKDDRRVLRHAGSIRRNVAYSIGSNSFNTLGINAAEGVPAAMVGKMKSNFGLFAIAYLEGSGLVEDISKTKITAKDWNTINPSKKIKENKDEARSEFVGTIKGIKAKVDKYKDIGETIKSINSTFDILPSFETYRLRPFSSKEDKLNKVKGSYFNAPDQAKKILTKLINEEYSFDSESFSIMNEIYGKGEEGRIKFLKSIGWKDLDDMKKSSSPRYLNEEIDVQEGVNRGLEAEYDQLIDLNDNIESKSMHNSIYFNWVFTVGGRFNLDSGDINPQGKNLLHRWLVLPKSAQKTKWNKNNDEFVYFKQGLLQGFGIGTDKLSDKSVDEKFDKIKDIDPKEIISGFKAGNKVNLNGVTLENEHPGHLFQAINALKAYQSSDDEFTATMVSEYDSVTSGFANKLMQAPILDENVIMEWLGKVGVFDGTEDVEEMGSVIEHNKILDSYKTLATKVGNFEGIMEPKKLVDGKWIDLNSDSTEAMKSLVSDWTNSGEAIPSIIVDGAVTKAARNLFKYPFMIFNYGASILNIKKNTARNLAIPVMNGILNDAYAYDSKIMKYIGVHSREDLNKLKKDLSDNGLDYVKAGNSKYSAVSRIEDLLVGSYGRAIESVMNETFKPLSELNDNIIQSTKIMFAIFKESFVDAVNKKETELSRPLSEDETKEIITSLEYKFPLIRGPLSDSRSDAISISSQKLASDTNDRIVKAGVKIKNRTTNEFVNNTVRAMRRELEEAHAAGAVLPMHWIDGTIIGESLMEGGALGVHDALVIGNDFHGRIKRLNKSMLSVGIEYTLVDNILSSFVETLESADPKFIAALNVDNIVFDTLSDLTRISYDTTKAREKLYAKKLVIQNFAGPKGTAFHSDYYSKPVVEDIFFNNIVGTKMVKNGYGNKLNDIINKIIEDC